MNEQYKSPLIKAIEVCGIYDKTMLIAYLQSLLPAERKMAEDAFDAGTKWADNLFNFNNLGFKIKHPDKEAYLNSIFGEVPREMEEKS